MTHRSFIHVIALSSVASLLLLCGCDTYDRPSYEFVPSEEDPFAEGEDPLVAAQNIAAGRGSVVSSAGEAEALAGSGGGGGGGGTGDPRLARARFAEAVRRPSPHPDDVQRATEALVGRDSRDIGDGNACEQAFTAFSAFTEELENVPGAQRGRPTRRERFMEACRAMPETVQQCWVPDYALAHKDECDEARGTPLGGGDRFADRTDERQASPSSARGIEGDAPDQSAATAEQRERAREGDLRNR